MYFRIKFGTDRDHRLNADAQKRLFETARSADDAIAEMFDR